MVLAEIHLLQSKQQDQRKRPKQTVSGAKGEAKKVDGKGDKITKHLGNSRLFRPNLQCTSVLQSPHYKSKQKFYSENDFKLFLKICLSQMFWFIFQFLFLLLCSWLGALHLPPVNSIQLLKLSEIEVWRYNVR